MAAPSVAKIEFPIVILGEAVLTAVCVERMAALDQQERFAVGHQRADAIDILTDARADEPDGSRLDGVMVRFLRRDFSGASFGLALALADKRARHAMPAARIIATGCIPCGGRGAIEPVDGFDAKARRVLATLDPSSGDVPVFAFATANQEDLTESTRAALAQAATDGRISLRAVDSIQQLADLWNDAEADRAIGRPNGRKPLLALLAVAAVGVIAAFGTVGWISTRQAPIRDCEGALTALEPANARQDGAKVAAAVARCGGAAAALPSSGRALFLAGQAHMLDGGRRLASSYWRRAALLGDRDGLAAYGRDLWLSGPGTPDAMREALRYLDAAAAQGSAAANEDLAEIYRDGIGVPKDLRRAETLLKRAEQLRKGADG